MSSNPLFKIDTSEREEALSQHRTMTISGAINKTSILLAIVVFAAYYAWTICAQGYMDKVHMLMGVGIIAGLVLAIMVMTKPQHSPILAPAYAICEGLVVGSISYGYGQAFQGIVSNAIGITIITLFSMLFLYKTGIIKATDQLRQIIFTATAAVAIFYLIGFIGASMGHPMTIFNGSPLGIGVSLLICGIAAFNYVIDFDFVERGAENQLPQYFEWYAGFGLLITTIWLYLEVLRYIVLSQSRD